MPRIKTHLYFVLKVLLAIIMLSTLVGIAGADLAPEVPLKMILLVCAIAAAILLAVFCFAIIIAGSVNQTIIRNGGTDNSWFWFKGEPPGLEKLRDELKEGKM